MVEKINDFWQTLTVANRLLIKKIVVASIALYTIFQLLGFLIPVAITGYAGYWVYKNVMTTNPRVLK